MKDFGEKMVQHLVLLEENLATLQGHCQRNFSVANQNDHSLQKGSAALADYVKRLAVHSMSRVECQAHFDNFFHQTQNLFQEVAVQMGQIQSHVSSLEGSKVNFQQLPALQAQMQTEIFERLKTELKEEISAAISGLGEDLFKRVMAQVRSEMLQALEGHQAHSQSSALQALRKQEATITEIVRRLHHRLQILEKQPAQASKICNLEVEVQNLHATINSIHMELQSWDEGWQGDPVPGPCPTFVASAPSTHTRTHPASSTHFACEPTFLPSNSSSSSCSSNAPTPHGAKTTTALPTAPKHPPPPYHQTPVFFNHHPCPLFRHHPLPFPPLNPAPPQSHPCIKMAPSLPTIN